MDEHKSAPLSADEWREHCELRDKMQHVLDNIQTGIINKTITSAGIDSLYAIHRKYMEQILSLRCAIAAARGINWTQIITVNDSKVFYKE